MSQQARLLTIQRMLEGGRCVPRSAMLKQLEVSSATLTRDLDYLRDRLGCPVEWDPQRGGYALVQGPGQPQQHFPGLWFSAQEALALLSMHELLSQLDAGELLRPHLGPLRRGLTRALQRGAGAPNELAQRVRILAQGARRVHLPHFQSLGAALMQRTRVHLRYLNRGRNTRSEREVSPQRLVHYRDNWYLDAWCHQRSALRTFSVDAIEALRQSDGACVDVLESELDDALATSYGIFAGKAVHEAGLRFLPPASRWVASERWHPEQVGQFDSEGRWRLRLPYSDMRELVMDILRWVPHVEVLWPQELADEVRRRLRQGLARMDGLDE